jgi:caffeoyl-CoA O-methyltransferase
LAITYDYIDDYLYRTAPARDHLLQKMEEEADTGAVPIIGPLVGRFLYNLARSARAKNILEIGTAIGYSGIWLARAVAPLKGLVTTIDKDPERVKRANHNIAEAKLGSTIKVVEGDALQILPTLKGEYDLVFLDTDKSIYLEAFKLSIKKLSQGGLFVADNTLWGGDVAKGGKSETTQIMIKFNKEVFSYPGLSTVIVPLRDGVTVGLKE